MTTPRSKPIPQVAIIGGGFCGAAAALSLLEKGIGVTIFERQAELGGLASSFDTGAYRLEKFYHQWYGGDENFEWLLNLLGLKSKEFSISMEHGFYFRDSVWRTRNPLDHFRYTDLSLTESARMAFGIWKLGAVTDWRTIDGYSVKDWFTKYGNHNVYEKFWKQLLVSRFGNYADEISVVWVWQKLQSNKARKGRNEKGSTASYYEGGFSALFDDIEAHILAQNGVIRKQTRAELVRADPSANTSITLQVDGSAHAFDGMIITTPLPEAARLLAHTLPQQNLDAFNAIAYLDSRGIIIRSKRSLSNCYWLSNRDLAFPFVGVIEHTQFRPPSEYNGEHIIYLSQSTAPGMEAYDMDDDAYIAYGLAHLEKMFADFDADWVINAHTWRAADAQPAVLKKYGESVPPPELPMANCLIATQAQVYPDYRGTHTAIRQGRDAAERLFQGLVS